MNVFGWIISCLIGIFMNTFFARALMHRNGYAAWAGLGLSLAGVGISCMMIGRLLR